MTISPEYNFYNKEAYESQCEWTLIQIILIRLQQFR